MSKCALGEICIQAHRLRNTLVQLKGEVTLTSPFNGTFSISYTLMSLISLYINVFHHRVTAAERMACTGHFHKKNKLKKQRKYKTTCFPFNRELSPECVCSCHLAILTNTLILPL